MNFTFPREIEDFRNEVRTFLEPYAELDGYLGQGAVWPQVRALFQAMGETLQRESTSTL